MKLELKSIKSLLDSFEIYKAIAEDEKDYIFLDSSKNQMPYGRYSIIGANKFLTVKYENNCIYEKWGHKDFTLFNSHSNIFQYMNEKIKKYEIKNNTGLPFIGGAIGYFSYDFGCSVEKLVPKSKEIVKVPDAYFVFYDNAVVIDNKTEEVYITALGIIKPSNESIDDLACKIEKSELKKIKKCKIENEKIRKIPTFKSPFDSTEYKETIEKMRNYIKEGHIYIANMTHTFLSEFYGNAENTYEKLRKVNPAPFSAYLPLENFHILCSSPERFLEVKDGTVQTRPIKGTIKRGKDLEEDKKNKNMLQNSEKDKSELLMIVDLERNDLSKVCKPGTVKVPELFKIEEFETVFHLVSTVTGELKNSCTAVDCLEATFPGGSITGAPKIRAMEIIDELEKNKRNIYTGAIGYFGFDGNSDFNIVIRSILVKDNYAYIGVGGGITWESDPQSEYEETIIKAVALFKSLESDYIV